MTSTRSGDRSGTTSASSRRHRSAMCSAGARCRALNGFPGTRVNYAGEYLRAAAGRDDDIAVIGVSQTREKVTWTFGELTEQVARVRTGLVRLGVTQGDRVVAYMPNLPETVAAFLATASLGATWAAVAPGVRPAGRHRPLRSARTGGAAHGRWIPLRRQGHRHRRSCRRDPCRHPVAPARCVAHLQRADRRRHDPVGRPHARTRRTRRACPCRSPIRSACSSRRAPRDCRRRSSTGTAGSSSRPTRTTH